MKVKNLFLIILILLLTIDQSAATSTLNYSYELTPDTASQNYFFNVTFEGPIKVYNGNLSIDNSIFPLKNGILNNSFYTNIPVNLISETVELQLTTSQGPIMTSFEMQHTSTNQSYNIVLELLFFIILIALITKYVIFYKDKK